MDVPIIFDNAGIYLQGVKNTLVLVSIAFAAGLALAVPLAVLRTRGHLLVQALIRAFAWFCRTTPILLQMFLLYYGFGQCEAARQTFLWPMFKEAYFCALFTFCLNTCAYATEMLRGAILATPPAEIQAAGAAGMSTLQLLRQIVLPRAFRRVSTYSKEILFLLHGSVLTSVVIFFNISGAARIVNSLRYSPYQALFSAALLYMTIILSIVFLVKIMKQYWHRRFLPLEERVTEMGGAST